MYLCIDTIYEEIIMFVFVVVGYLFNWICVLCVLLEFIPIDIFLSFFFRSSVSVRARGCCYSKQIFQGSSSFLIALSKWINSIRWRKYLFINYN